VTDSEADRDAAGSAAVAPARLAGRSDPVSLARLLPEGKLHAPAVRAQWIARPDLLARLGAAGGARLVVVAAPAGYGKSTLLAQWTAREDMRPAPAWLSLDGLDNDPVRLWTGVLLALGRAWPGLGAAELVTRLRVQDPDLTGAVLPALISSLQASTARLALVLDDFHAVVSPDCLEQVQQLLAGLERASFQLVLSTREAPPLALARLRAAGDLVELGMKDLRFTSSDTARLLPAVAGVDLREVQVADLVRRAEGWPAGIYLAALSLRQNHDPAGFVRRFAGNDRHIADFLTEEVLARAPQRQRDFLARTAILDRFTAPLCAAVTGMADAEADALLSELAATNLFVIALDEQRLWYRYHQMFAQTLTGRLTATEPAVVGELHRRAARWFAGHGYVDEAVRHAIAAGDTGHAIELIAAHWLGYVATGQVATTRAMIEAIGEQATAADSVASVCAAWLAAVSGDLPAAVRWLDIAENLGHDGPLPDGTRSLKSAVALIRATFVYSDVSDRLAEARTAAAAEDDPASAWYTLARAVLGLSLYLDGQHRAALAALREAVSTPVTPVLFHVLALAVQSLASAALGRHAQAAALAAAAREAVDTHNLGDSAQATIAITAHGAALIRAGNLPAARTELEHVVRVRARTPGLLAWPALLNLVALAQLGVAQADRHAAGAACDEAGDLLARIGHGGFIAEQIFQIRASLRHAPSTVSVATAALTAAELTVLHLLPSQLSLPGIAAHLHVSVNTIKSHSSAIYRKLGVTSRAAAIRQAQHRGILP
jgi:LuxR family maltose regulon positive regulatory protein